MEKRSHGQIRTHDRKDGPTTYSLRVRAYGRREVVTLGTDAEGWTMRKAERKLEEVLAEIQVGVWRPPSMSAGGRGSNFPRVRLAVVVRSQVGAASNDAGRL
jgi:hypothetical protein